MDIKPVKKKKAIKSREKKDRTDSVIMTIFIAIILIAVFGVVSAVKQAADWGASHQIVEQPIVAQMIRFQLPYRIEDREPVVVVSPLADDFVEKAVNDEFTPIEKKVIDRWGYRDGVLALAIFSCESGLDQYAVSATGDLGIAQINWATWKGHLESRFEWNASDMFDVDRNLDAAYIVWDRGDGEEGNEAGTWDGWTVYNTGTYLSCL